MAKRRIDCGNRLVDCGGLIACGLGCERRGSAQPYPAKPIKVIVPYTPGSPVDVLARVVTQQLSTQLAQTVVIDNRPGAGTTIGTKTAATRRAGRLHAAVRSATSLVIAPALYQESRLRSGEELRAGRQCWRWSSQVMVVRAVAAGADRRRSSIAYAKANPGKLNFGFGQGTAAAASSARCFKADQRHRHRQHALQGRHAGDHRHAGRARSR